MIKYNIISEHISPSSVHHSSSDSSMTYDLIQASMHQPTGITAQYISNDCVCAVCAMAHVRISFPDTASNTSTASS